MNFLFLSKILLITNQIIAFERIYLAFFDENDDSIRRANYL
ncbi:hypothetical protein BTN49_1502 [Candidatus Enterovibrio escicola]|uniref:Uncharacterized protein n=1 Tax=Candidatus Enterovibrio escicola TaxID=1927127 RepID=A0A2A5T467_9GAMM|nr:hypothetical protein BTN49_1502 [Candidatus Enterovibrio escacola]